MPNYLGYNPYQDASGMFSGASDTLGSTILRSAMLQQSQAQRQQELMMELAKMRQQQEQFLSTHQLGVDELAATKDWRGKELQARGAALATEAPERAARAKSLEMSTKLGEFELGEKQSQKRQQQQMGEALTKMFSGTSTGTNPPAITLPPELISAASALVADPAKMASFLQNIQALKSDPTGLGRFNVPPGNVAMLGQSPIFTNTISRLVPPSTEVGNYGRALAAVGNAAPGDTNTIQQIIGRIRDSLSPSGGSAQRPDFNVPSFATEEAALKSGVKGKVIINGRPAQIN